MCDVKKLDDIYRRLSYLGAHEVGGQSRSDEGKQMSEEDEYAALYNLIIRRYTQIKEQLVTEFKLERVPHASDHYTKKISLAENDAMHIFEPQQTISLSFTHSYDEEAPCILINMWDDQNNRCIPKGEDYKTARGDFRFIRDTINQFIRRWMQRYTYAIDFIKEAMEHGFELSKKEDERFAFYLTKDSKPFWTRLQFNAQFQPTQSSECADAALVYKTNRGTPRHTTFEDVTAKNLLALILSDISSNA